MRRQLGPWAGVPFVRDRYKWGMRITIESARGYGRGRPERETLFSVTGDK